LNGPASSVANTVDFESLNQVNLKDTEDPVSAFKQNRVMAANEHSDDNALSRPLNQKSDAGGSSAGAMDRKASAKRVSSFALANVGKMDVSALANIARMDVSALANIGKINTSALLADIGRMDVSALANIGQINTSALLADIGKMDVSALANIGNDLLVRSPAFIDVLDDFFAELPEAEQLMAGASAALELTVPFGHDRAVRTALQIIIVSSLFTTLFVAFMVNPFLAAALSAVGTPNAVVTWKATGRAYDRLNGRENNHPEKVLEKKNPPSRGKRHRRIPGDRDSW